MQDSSFSSFVPTVRMMSLNFEQAEQTLRSELAARGLIVDFDQRPSHVLISQSTSNASASSNQSGTDSALWAGNHRGRGGRGRGGRGRGRGFRGNPQQQQNSGNSGKEVVVRDCFVGKNKQECWTCGMPGHYSKDCPVAAWLQRMNIGLVANAQEGETQELAASSEVQRDT
ncbi:cold shock protein 2-like [Selaginella moellendorffii]|uniref:cold shock protein 2-like n=1 Tax=Selaginella moellendorffii TaxID=88036 RepID=UPI000D1D095B|nr:cold shock protein 2-like [Selaginella moellendorffii]|eukprot:XP_024518513.1 cold shock protein 2-like [Selaginella moellendorffii]